MNNRKEDMEISSHYRQLLRELNEQRQHGILCDACVIVDGKIFKAHKNVLLGSSRYFKTLYCQVRDCLARENWSVGYLCVAQFSIFMCLPCWHRIMLMHLCALI